MALWSDGLIDPVDTLTNSHACWSTLRVAVATDPVRRGSIALCTADLNSAVVGIVVRGCHWQVLVSSERKLNHLIAF